MVKETSVIDVSNCGAVQNLTIPLEAGTVVVLEGKNGAGKSTAINSVRTGVTGKSCGVPVRDGAAAGAVKLPGVTVRIGARLSKSGKASHSFVLLEDGDRISGLIDPGVKSEEAADKRRLEALLAIRRIDNKQIDVRGFLGEDLHAAMLRGDALPSNAVDLVAAIKRWLDKQAREYESDVYEASGAISQIGELPEVGLAVPDVDATRQVLTSLEREYATASAKRPAEDESLVSIDAAAAYLPEESVLVDAITARQVRIDALLAEQDADSANLRDVCQQRARYQSLRAKIDAAQSVEAIEKMAAGVESMQTIYEQQVIAKVAIAQAVTQRDELVILKSRREKSEFFAAECREKAKKTASLLNVAVDGLEGWLIREGDFRLCVQHSRGVIPFSELSPGEKAIMALEVLVSCTDFGTEDLPIITLPQEVYESLDTENKAMVVKFAADRGVCILTALATEGQVHATVNRIGE